MKKENNNISSSAVKHVSLVSLAAAWPPSWLSANTEQIQAQKPVQSPACTPADPATCPHDTVEETRTSDGYVNRQCRDCGEWLPCQKVKT
jgi:hypothetical protein